MREKKKAESRVDLKEKERRNFTLGKRREWKQIRRELCRGKKPTPLPKRIWNCWDSNSSKFSLYLSEKTAGFSGFLSQEIGDKTEETDSNPRRPKIQGRRKGARVGLGTGIVVDLLYLAWECWKEKSLGIFFISFLLFYCGLKFWNPFQINLCFAALTVWIFVLELLSMCVGK